jgi:2-phospho-L-lactate transferase/gluconeogenesis factor (CofD/UPF0052 family)
VLDLILVSPVLVPVLALLWLGNSGKAARAIIDIAKAEAVANEAKSAEARAVLKTKSVEMKLKESEATVQRKVDFFQGKLDQQRKENAEAVKRAKATMRDELDAQKRKAEEATAKVACMPARSCEAMRLRAATTCQLAPLAWLRTHTTHGVRSLLALLARCSCARWRSN